MSLRKLMAVAVSTAVIACGGSDDPQPDLTKGGTAPTAFQGSYTLQGTIIDAVTGAHVGGDDLQLFLVQGGDVRRPDRLIRDAKDPLAGEYAFQGIPADYNSGNKLFKVVATKGGYLRFEGEIAFQINPGAVLDETYNKIGNIYLFPVGSVAPDYKVTVVYNGKPVPNATAYLQVAESTAADASKNGVAVGPDVIPATAGYVPAVSGTTDASGSVTFPGAQLALGVQYTPVVAPIVFEGVQLQLGTAPPFFEGISPALAMTTVSMVDAVPGSNPYGLYVASASNGVSGQVDASGTLTLVFSRPVSLSVPATGQPFSATTTSTTGRLDGATPVTFGLSADGRTLTLQPKWAVQPAATDTKTSITYGNGVATLSVQGYPGAGFPLFTAGGATGLVNAAGVPVSGTVQLTP